MKPNILGYFTHLRIYPKGAHGLITCKVKLTVDKSAQNGFSSGNCAKVYQFIA